MGNIFEEYRRRHNITTIVPITEGVLFLEKEGLPTAIFLTSSFAKCLGMCRACKPYSGEIVFEMVFLSSFPACIAPTRHDHISADADIADFIPGDLVPYVSKGERDQERWLWNFFLLSTQNRRSMGARGISEMYSRENRCQDPSLVWLDDQFWLAENCPDTYSQYYDCVYSPFSINRKYLLRA